MKNFLKMLAHVAFENWVIPAIIMAAFFVGRWSCH